MGLISKVKAILDEVPLGWHRVEAGLLLRRAVLVNSLLYTMETWSGQSERDVARFQVVDTAMLQAITGGHCKTPVEFHFLESGSLMLKHILTINRLMYHHHLVTRDDKETIKKIYKKQKEEKTKGDWFDLLLKDFEFIGSKLEDDDIKKMPKEEYKKHINEKVRNAAFLEMLQMKQQHSKIKEVNYPSFTIQPYLRSKQISNKEKVLLYLLRSKCHSSKLNFRRMHTNNLFCIFGCNAIKDQTHIFTQCRPVISQISVTRNLDHNNIFKGEDDQCEIIHIFTKIEEMRSIMKEQLLPGEADARTPGDD